MWLALEYTYQLGSCPQQAAVSSCAPSSAHGVHKGFPQRLPQGTGITAVSVGALQGARRQQVRLDAAIHSGALGGEGCETVKGSRQRGSFCEGDSQLPARLRCCITHQQMKDQCWLLLSHRCYFN